MCRQYSILYPECGCNWQAPPMRCNDPASCTGTAYYPQVFQFLCPGCVFVDKCIPEIQMQIAQAQATAAAPMSDLNPFNSPGLINMPLPSPNYIQYQTTSLFASKTPEQPQGFATRSQLRATAIPFQSPQDIQARGGHQIRRALTSQHNAPLQDNAPTTPAQAQFNRVLQMAEFSAERSMPGLAQVPSRSDHCSANQSASRVHALSAPPATASGVSRAIETSMGVVVELGGRREK